jgi:uncharacterized protein
MQHLLNHVEGFEWDTGNSRKNALKHDVDIPECEQIFSNKPLVIFHDTSHSLHETRYRVLGRTDDDRKLFLVFTLRKNCIRVISARPMNKRERETYEEAY